MPSSESVSPANRLSMGDRTNSTQSISKTSPPGKAKPHRAHIAGHGRLHTRNPSYPKNLNKTTKTSDEDGMNPKPRKKSQTPSTSPANTHVKRNSSTVSLPRTGSKVNVRRNASNVSLKRNTSHTHVQNTSRPTTPLKKNHSSDLDQLEHQNSSRFLLDEEEDPDDDWTEESASQSPSVTRQSPSSKRTSGKNTPNEDARQERAQGSEIFNPPATLSKQQSSDVDESTKRRLHGRPPDVDALTTRLLSRNTSFKLSPLVSSVSASGTPGTHTPPLAYDGQSDQPQDSSLPENGISRFINAPSSLSGSTTHLQTALQNSQRSRRRARSASPLNSEGDNLRRTQSSGNLTLGSARPIATLQQSDSHGTGRSPPSYTVEPAPRRRANMTQLRMDLWRGRDAVEPPHGPPPSILDRLPVGELPAEERRTRQWDKAEAEMNYLRRFRNPVVEAAKRWASKMKEDGRRSAPTRTAVTREARHNTDQQVNGAVNTDRGRRDDQRTPSRGGPRSVHFEVGLDAGEELGGEREQGPDAVERLLRSLWTGGEMEHAGED